MNGFILVSCFSSNDLVLQKAEKLKEVFHCQSQYLDANA